VPLVNSFDQLFGWSGRTTERTLPAGIGSGVIVSKEGHVLTNHHVIEGSQQFTVQLTDGRSLPAKLIGSDPNVDIAVLQRAPQDAGAAKFALMHRLHANLARADPRHFAQDHRFGELRNAAAAKTLS
jgi:S1-C subfamily serine protease